MNEIDVHYLACVGREGKKSFERSAISHRQLMLLRPILTVTTV